jgi:RimJ/RimL family protein N-acetyltransferase
VVCATLEPVGGLQLRPWHEEDVSVLASAWQDPAIARWNPVPPDSSTEFAANWIRGTARQNIASIGIDVVLVDDGNTVFGEIGFQVDPERSIAEIGFWLHADARGRGFGRTLLVMADRFAEQLELVGLIALVDVRNDAASGLLTKAAWNELPTTSTRRAFANRIS